MLVRKPGEFNWRIQKNVKKFTDFYYIYSTIIIIFLVNFLPIQSNPDWEGGSIFDANTKYR